MMVQSPNLTLGFEKWRFKDELCCVPVLKYMLYHEIVLINQQQRKIKNTINKAAIVIDYI